MSAAGILLNLIRSLGYADKGLAGEKLPVRQPAGRFGCCDMTTPLRRQCFVALDCETTGFEPERGDRVISLAAVRLVNGELAAQHFSALVNPQRPVPEVVTALTGINNEMLTGQPLLAEVMPEFLEFIRGGIITGFNVGFDLAFLNREMRRGSREVLPAAHSLDVYVLGRLLQPNCSHRSLEEMALAYQVPVEGRHTALGDSIMAARLLQVMLPHLEQKQIGNLQDLADYLCYCSLY